MCGFHYSMIQIANHLLVVFIISVNVSKHVNLMHMMPKFDMMTMWPAFDI